MQAMRSGSGEPDQGAMRKAMEDMQAKEKKELDAVLEPAQLARLKELQLQRTGNMAIMNPDVQKSLDMSEAQLKSVKDLQQKQMDAMSTIRDKMQNGEMDFQQARPLFEKNMKIMGDELAKILTEGQRKKLADMGGKPFTFDKDEERGPGGQ
jgi:alkyl sulfatase BDS1-like metallo-beta-lactamase superfamily hydrolase